MSTTTLAGADRLKRDSLGLSEVIAATLANIAPAMSFFFGFSLIVGGAGVGAPVTIIVAMVAVLFLANTLAEFSRFRPSTGSFITFIGMTFGPAAGAAASLFVVIGYNVSASSVLAIAGYWVSQTLITFLGIHVPWQLLTIAATALATFLVARGINISTTWAAILFYLEVGLLTVGAVIMLVVNHGAISMAPLLFSSVASGWKGIGLGFPLAIYLFIGWENAAMLAEETTSPRRNVPKALFTAAITIGIFYIFLAFATETAFHNDAAKIGASSNPFVDAFKASAAGFLIVAYLAGVSSIFSSLIGLCNAQARMLFSSSREGLLPPFFGKIHPRRKTPHIAIYAYMGLGLAIILGFGTLDNIDPLSLFGDTGSLGSIPIIITYMLTNLALPVYVWSRHRTAFNVFKHAILPIAGAVVMIMPLWGLVQPGQPYPFNIYPYLSLGLLVIAIVYGVIMSRANPNLVQRIGSYVADEEF